MRPDRTKKLRPPKKTPFLDKLKKELDSSPRPRLSEIGAKFIRMCGGPEMFAEKIFTEFESADAGSTVRKNILGLVFQTLKTDEEQFTSDSLEDLEEADLEILLNTRLEQLGVVDAPQEEGPEAPGGDSGHRLPTEAGQKGDTVEESDRPAEGTAEENPGGSGEAQGEPEGDRGATPQEDDWPPPLEGD